MKMKSSKTRTVEGFLDSELEAVLTRAGLLSQLDAGDLFCSSCGKQVTRESLGGLFFRNRAPHVICSDVRCYLAALEKLENHGGGQ